MSAALGTLATKGVDASPAKGIGAAIMGAGYAGLTEKSGDSQQTAKQEVRQCIASLMETHSPSPTLHDKRKDRRYTFRKPLMITPVNETTGVPDVARTFPAFGLDISVSGIGFLSRQLTPTRRAVLTCDGCDGRPIHVLFEPRWVRFTRGGWYQTGGQFHEVLSGPLDIPAQPRCYEVPLLDGVCATPGERATS